jgi:hypothetical protein
MSASTTHASGSLVALLREQGEQQKQDLVDTVDNDLTTAFANFVFAAPLDAKRSVTGLLSQFNDGNDLVLGQIAAGTGEIDDRTALQALLNSDKLPEGVKKAIQSIVTSKVKVEDDGTISDVKRLEGELATAKTSPTAPTPPAPADPAEIATLKGAVKSTLKKLTDQHKATETAFESNKAKTALIGSNVKHVFSTNEYEAVAIALNAEETLHEELANLVK